MRALVLMAVMMLLIPSQKTAAACVAQELQNGGAVIITGEIVLDDVRSGMKQTIKKAAERKQRRSDIELLAEVMFHENWNTDAEHLAAYYTGAVVMNRVNSDDWPDTVRDVLYQTGQYSTTGKFFTKTVPDECLEMARRIIEDGTPDVPETVVFQSMRKQGSGVWKLISTDYFCYQ